MRKQSHFAWLVLFLLVATALRLHDIGTVPPGMTHDEADHGLDAWGVVQGERPIYFTVGYGREPLFDYSTAVLMSFLGPSHLAGRLTAAYFSLLLIAGTYAWARLAVGRQVALLTAAGLAVGFWPVATGRQALRSVTMPALFVLATALFWRATRRAGRSPRPGSSRALLPFLAAGLLLGLTFYTYIPARVMWLLFPAHLLYRAITARSLHWRGTALTLLVAGLVGAPLFLYLYTHPQAEVRIEQLAEPLRAAARGDFSLLLTNIGEGLKLPTIRGDQQWRYNIAGRPLLSLLPGLLFYAGVALGSARLLRCRRRQSGHCGQAPALFFALLWLLLGLAPALVTGANLATTQVIAAQPVLFLFPALALSAGAHALAPRLPGHGRRWLTAAAVLLFFSWGTFTARAYFSTWANSPEVAVQYEADLVQAIRYLNDYGAGHVAVSTDAPHRFHDPATAFLFLDNPQLTLQWFDGRYSLLLPGGVPSSVLVTASAPLHPLLTPYLEQVQETVTPLAGGRFIHRLAAIYPEQALLFPQLSTEYPTISTDLSTVIHFSDTLHLLGYKVASPPVAAGGVVQLVTAWQVETPPERELVLFTHILDGNGAVIAQDDRLDAPSSFWQRGDRVFQRHEIVLPSDLPPGEYGVRIGVYPEGAWRSRLPVLVDGVPQGDLLTLPPLVVNG